MGVEDTELFSPFPALNLWGPPKEGIAKLWKSVDHLYSTCRLGVNAVEELRGEGDGVSSGLGNVGIYWPLLLCEEL